MFPLCSDPMQRCPPTVCIYRGATVCMRSTAFFGMIFICTFGVASHFHLSSPPTNLSLRPHLGFLLYKPAQGSGLCSTTSYASLPPSTLVHSMSQTVSFISFHDLSTDGRFLWASPTVYDVLGYEAEELVGRCGYDIVYPEDLSQGKEFHKETFINDLVASQIVVRYRAKDGRPVPCLCVISLCYDFLVNSATVLDQAAEACKFWIFLFACWQRENRFNEAKIPHPPPLFTWQILSDGHTPR